VWSGERVRRLWCFCDVNRAQERRISDSAANRVVDPSMKNGDYVLARSTSFFFFGAESTLESNRRSRILIGSEDNGGFGSILITKRQSIKRRWRRRIKGKRPGIESVAWTNDRAGSLKE